MRVLIAEDDAGVGGGTLAAVKPSANHPEGPMYAGKKNRLSCSSALRSDSSTLTSNEYGYAVISPPVLALPPYIAKIFGAQNTGRPHETFSKASGKLKANRRNCSAVTTIPHREPNDNTPLRE